MDKRPQDEAPDQRFTPLLGNLFHDAAAALAKETGARKVRVECEYSYERDERTPGGICLKVSTIPRREGAFPAPSFTARGRELLKDYASAVSEDSGATGVRIHFVLEWRDEAGTRNGRGRIRVRTFTTPDAKTERMLDPKIRMPRGSMLQRDVEGRLIRQFKFLRRKQA